MPRLLLLLATTFILAACGRAPEPASVFPTGTLVDLSHTYDAQTVFWPTADPFRLEKVSDGVTEGGWYYAANNVFTSEHGGTHIDAPVHFAAGKRTVDRVPLEQLVAPIVLVDVAAKCRDNADYQVTTQDLLDWEQANGTIAPDSILLLHTGFAERWPDTARYMGTAERGEAGASRLHFPGLHPNAARWLVENRPVKAVGLDTASIDYGPSTTFESHRALFAHDIPAFENLTALDRIPPRGAFIIALPMKIGGGSGAPLRAIAVVPPSGSR